MPRIFLSLLAFLGLCGLAYGATFGNLDTALRGGTLAAVGIGLEQILIVLNDLRLRHPGKQPLPQSWWQRMIG